MKNRLVFAFCLLNLALAAGGCAKAKAASLPAGAPLQMPAPPPHVIEIEEVAAAPAPAASPAEPAATTPRPPARPPAARPEPRTDTPAVAAQPVPTPPAEPRGEVRAVPSSQSAADERKVRDLMAQAARDLGRVDYQRLSREGKSQYDQSKRFSEEAQAAMKQRNFVYAVTLADKAATLAAELAGR